MDPRSGGDPSAGDGWCGRSACLSGRTPGGGRPFNLVSEESGLALVGQLLREAPLLRLRLRRQRGWGRGAGRQGWFDRSSRNKRPTHRTLRPKQTEGNGVRMPGSGSRRWWQRTSVTAAHHTPPTCWRSSCFLHVQLSSSVTVPSHLCGMETRNCHLYGASNPGEETVVH